MAQMHGVDIYFGGVANVRSGRATQPIYLIVDRGPANISKDTRNSVKTLGDNFKLSYLAPIRIRSQSPRIDLDAPEN
jgi:hypothetical protein